MLLLVCFPSVQSSLLKAGKHPHTADGAAVTSLHGQERATDWGLQTYQPPGLQLAEVGSTVGCSPPGASQGKIIPIGEGFLYTTSSACNIGARNTKSFYAQVGKAARCYCKWFHKNETWRKCSRCWTGGLSSFSLLDPFPYYSALFFSRYTQHLIMQFPLFTKIYSE